MDSYERESERIRTLLANVLSESDHKRDCGYECEESLDEIERRAGKFRYRSRGA